MAEENFLFDYPGLKPFLLSDVRRTEIGIGGGAYAKLEEVALSVGATVYAFLREGEDTVLELPKAATELVKQCQLLSTLRHPNIVKFLGVTFFPGSRLPAFVMERLLTSLHDLLAPDLTPASDSVTPLDFFSIGLKCRVLHGVTCGLTYLHERTQPIVHCDLSARNILLDSDMVGKIADLGVSRTVSRVRASTAVRTDLVYKPPEIISSTSGTHVTKNDPSIDIYALGIIALFTLSENLPCTSPRLSYTDEKTGLIVVRTELQQRSDHMRYVNEQLTTCRQLSLDYPLIKLIQQCVQYAPVRRPAVHDVLCLLDEAQANVGDEDCERSKCELVKALHTQSRIQVRCECKC